MIGGDSIRAVSFDCFGTLIDWQRGILDAVAGLPAPARPALCDEDLITRFAAAERDAERPPWRSYRHVLEAVAEALAPRADRTFLWRSLASWPAFADTSAALRRLQARFRVAIASNVDADLWSATQEKLGITPDLIVTADAVRSYKPGRAHFDALCRGLALRPSEILHAGESLYHDIEPAAALGFPTVRVQRVTRGPTASGPPTGATEAGLTVPSVRALADVVAAG